MSVIVRVMGGRVGFGDGIGDLVVIVVVVVIGFGWVGVRGKREYEDRGSGKEGL